MQRNDTKECIRVLLLCMHVSYVSEPVCAYYGNKGGRLCSVCERLEETTHKDNESGK
ncbi:hypothetical protein FACS189472_18350 [Alphaproteobacteria bacterium]|nr:hypothetical protein FACS189472_18350 [Alphaproteobacteria bacterium]